MTENCIFDLVQAISVYNQLQSFTYYKISASAFPIIISLFRISKKYLPHQTAAEKKSLPPYTSAFKPEPA